MPPKQKNFTILSKIDKEIRVDLFNVVQFFPNGQFEYVRRRVPVEEAFEAFKHYTTLVGAQIGTTARVIITDSGDLTNAEWKFGEGIVFPTKEMCDEVRKR
jgi:hypothetical protein